MKGFCRIIPSLVVSLFCMAWLVGCKPGTPKKYLSPGELEDVLYDYHKAIGMLNAQDLDIKDYGYQYELYKLAVLKKHGVSEQQFDESMVYYMRHADRLQEVYKSLSERLHDEASKVGISVAEISDEGGVAGDTTNVWPLAPNAVLMQKEPYHLLSFVVPADTSFHKGDKFVLDFQSSFLFQEGFKEGIAVLALRFANDSVASRNVHFTMDNRYDLMLEDNEDLGIKELRGFFYLSKEQRETTEPSLKVLVLDQMKLLRIHRRKPSVVTGGGNDVKPADSAGVNPSARERNVNDTSSATPKRVFVGDRPPQVSR